MNLTEEIVKKSKEILEGEIADCIIGYGRATDSINARPLFAYDPQQADKLIFDQTCTHNLANYLHNRKGKVTGIVAKPCDSRAINLLLNEHQIERDKVIIIGVVCPGIVETGWNKTGEKLRAACEVCRQHTPPLYDYLIGEPPASEPESEPYQDVAEMEAMSAEERRVFWEEHFSRCIRCYACRQVCPGCYCSECFVARLDPLWVGIRIAPGENEMWNTIRPYHLAGRCIGCNQCERVC
ncbi:hypothetical protein ACFLW2_05250, partial [Chloroflexota bacterium]